MGQNRVLGSRQQVWSKGNADFASAVKQPARPHHRFKTREELRRQTFIARERRVIFSNQRFAHGCNGARAGSSQKVVRFSRT